jgi:hypothetical protein
MNNLCERAVLKKHADATILCGRPATHEVDGAPYRWLCDDHHDDHVELRALDENIRNGTDTEEAFTLRMNARLRKRVAELGS